MDQSLIENIENNTPYHINLLINDKCALLKESDNYKKSLDNNSKFEFLFNTLQGIEVLEYTHGLLSESWTPLTKQKILSMSTNDVFVCRLKNYKNLKYGINGIKDIELPIYDQHFLLTSGTITQNVNIVLTTTMRVATITTPKRAALNIRIPQIRNNIIKEINTDVQRKNNAINGEILKSTGDLTFGGPPLPLPAGHYIGPPPLPPPPTQNLIDIWVNKIYETIKLQSYSYTDYTLYNTQALQQKGNGLFGSIVTSLFSGVTKNIDSTIGKEINLLPKTAPDGTQFTPEEDVRNIIKNEIKLLNITSLTEGDHNYNTLFNNSLNKIKVYIKNVNPKEHPVA
jgi:hypothetical protein